MVNSPQVLYSYFELMIHGEAVFLGERSFVSLITIFSTLFCFTGVASASTDNPDKAAATKAAYALQIQALEGPTFTDLYVNTSPTTAAITALSSLKKVQLKTFDKNDNLIYTQNYNDGIAAPNGSADIQLTNVSRHQPLQTEVLVQNDQTTNTEVLKAQGIVLLRPELSVDKIDTMSTAYVNTPISVSTIIKELNGDLGANFTVQILNGNNVLDEANNVQVAAGGTQPVAFALKFSQPGTYTLRALISNVQPGEYDAKNNEKDFTIQVIQPDKTVQYSSSYYSSDYNYDENSNDYNYGNYHISEIGSYDQFDLSAQTPDHFTPSGTFTLNLHDSSGASFNEQFTNVQFYDEGNGYKYYEAYDATTGGFLWITQSQYGTNLQYRQYGGQYTYSDNYYEWYGNTSMSYGTLFQAHGQLAAHFEFPSSSDVIYGGNYSMDLNNLPDVNESVSYQYDGYYDNYSYQNTNQVQGFSSGVTTW